MDGSFEKGALALTPLVSDLFTVDAIYPHNNRLVVSLSHRYDRRRSTALLKERLEMAGYQYSLDENGDGPVLLTIDPHRRLKIPPLNLILFVVTLLSVYFVPVFMMKRMYAEVALAADYLRRGLPEPSEWILTWQSLRYALAPTFDALRHGAGLQFTAAMVSILFVHEMGHFVVSRRRNIITSWPYFIPAPNIIGTFGAVIRSKSPFWNRRDLIEVGAAGPIAGWVVALFWLIYGLSRSTIVPDSLARPDVLLWGLQGESLLMRVLAPWLAGVAPPGHSYLFTEAAFAGWVGLLVTAINMLPIGQLDGGHIVYGLIRGQQRILGWIGMTALVALGFHSPMWWIFAVFGLIFGVAHPPTLDDRRPISTVALVMAVAALIILVISFTPVPFQLPDTGPGK